MITNGINNSFEKFEVGMKVQKLSGRPFKSGAKIETIVSFGINEIDPLKRHCAIFQDGSVCNLYNLEKTIK
jgi:hypothetical protein